MKRQRSTFIIRPFRKVSWLLAVVAASLMFSCEEVMNVDFTGDSQKNLVIEGAITTDTTSHKVILSYTGDYFSIPEKEMATGAIVYIQEGENTIPLREAGAGTYFTEPGVAGKVGKKYTLHVKLTDGREFTASDSLRACSDIDSIRQSVNYNTFLSGYGYDVLFYGHEPQPAGDYYMYELKINNKLYTDTITETSFASDEFVNGNFVQDYAVYRIREKDLKDITQIVTLEMYSITKQYYNYLSALMVETIWRGSPWDGPPANLPSNVSNGGTGFFRASDVKRKSRIFVQSSRVN